MTRDVERLAGDVAELVPSLVKPVLDLAWFSSQLWALTGRRGSAILYLYAALGFSCLRCGIWAAVCFPSPPAMASLCTLCSASAACSMGVELRSAP